MVLEAKAGWDGMYEFEGLEPGAELLLEFDPISPAPPVQLPPLAPGGRHVVPEVVVPIACGSGAA